jgi:tetratricopeptide (TPR) repeat protein
MTERYRVTHLSEIDARGPWIPIRRDLGIRAFGVNAWRATAAGEEIIPEHDEIPTGHEELYFVLAGHAAFTVDGESVDAPAGTFVFVRDPQVKRAAKATEPETTIVTAGAKPGEAYEPRPWEENADILPLFEAEDYELARERTREALERHPDAAGLLYNLACAESRLGETAAALEHLRRSVELEPRFAEYAQTDDDLAAIRDEEGFPAA